MVITREQMIDLQADWFAWQWGAHARDRDPHCLHIGAYYSDVIDAMQWSWVYSYGAAEGALETALDILIHPPDLSHRSYWKVEDFDVVEFNISNIYFAWKWFYPFSRLWFEAMTPLLHNRVTVSPDSNYTTARELTLRMVGSERRSQWTVIEATKREPLYDWLEPLVDSWKELTNAEKDAFRDALSWLYAEPTARGHQFLIKLRRVIDPLDVPWIDEWLTEPI